MNELSPVELLAAAHVLVERPTEQTEGYWARAAALLMRQALEGAVYAHWTRTEPRLTMAPYSTQLLCLREYIADTELADSAANTWAGLSRACHHHGYGLGVTGAELRGWGATVSAIIRVVR